MEWNNLPSQQYQDAAFEGWSSRNRRRTRRGGGRRGRRRGLLRRWRGCSGWTVTKLMIFTISTGTKVKYRYKSWVQVQDIKVQVQKPSKPILLSFVSESFQSRFAASSEQWSRQKCIKSFVISLDLEIIASWRKSLETYTIFTQRHSDQQAEQVYTVKYTLFNLMCTYFSWRL